MQYVWIGAYIFCVSRCFGTYFNAMYEEIHTASPHMSFQMIGAIL